MKTGARWETLKKMAIAVAVFFWTVAPGVCAALCQAQICCPVTAVESCCTHESELPTVETAAPAMLCCDSMAAQGTPDAVISQRVELVPDLLAVLPQPSFALVSVSVVQAPIEVENDRGPPGPSRDQHPARGPPMV